MINNFERQVKLNSKNIAVDTSKKVLTYQKLNSDANVIVQKTKRVIRKEFDTKVKIRVGVLLEYGADMVIGVVSAIKMNCPYIPLDSHYPISRLDFIVKDSGLNIILTDDKNIHLARRISDNSTDNIRIVNINMLDYSLDAPDEKKIDEENEIAYILYTSGSTGKPKGVYQSYENVSHFISCYSKTLAIKDDDRMSLVASLSHDASIMDIYGALFNGATLFPLDIKEINNFEEIVSWIEKEKITIWHSVPTVYRYLMESMKEGECENLRFIVLGGENVVENDIKIFRNKLRSTKLVNLYGQTESSFNSAQIYKVQEETCTISLGEAVDNTELIVVDENREEVDILKTGEIVVLSKYVAKGYWGNDALTHKVFEDIDGGERLYWTGDLGKVLVDGSIKFIGRKNSVIKIRGYRVDTGDVESNLMEFDGIGQAAAIAVEEDNEFRLIAFYVGENNLKDTEILNFMASRVPSYMVPSRFIKLAEFPVTDSGKTNRKQLEKIFYELKEEIVFESPMDEVEKKLQEIWINLLRTEKIGVTQNFFNLGGHSLKAIILIGEIHKVFQVHLPVIEIFNRPTIRELGECIKSSDRYSFEKISKVEEKDCYQTTAAQKRIYAIQNLDKKSTAYNMPSLFELQGNVDIEKLEKTFKELVNRHEELRAYFEIVKGDIVKKIDGNYVFKIDTIDITCSNENNINEVCIKEFELDKSSLFRVKLINNNEKKYLFIDMHHIISDATSVGILIKEFVDLYRGEQLEPLSIQYKDYAEWQNERLKEDEIKKEEDYWINIFDDEIPVLRFPTDFERPIVKSLEGDTMKFKIDEETTSTIRNIAKESNCTIYMVMLSALNLLLSKYSGQEDIIIGTPVAGRTHADTQSIIGVFVNTLALRNKPQGSKPYIQFLNEVKENCIQAYQNQNLQFEELIKKIKIKRDTSRNPLFDVLFNMINVDYGDDLEINELTLKPCNRDNKVSKFDLSLTVLENSDDITFSLEYCTKLFKENTVKLIGKRYIEILKNLSKDLSTKIEDISMLNEVEEKKLLGEYNSTELSYSKEKTIHSLFEEQVEKNPESVALVFENKSLTYNQINKKANQLARLLKSEGAKANKAVAIMLDRSPEMMIAILGILKSGAAYLPIDSSYPRDRVNQILDDADIDLVVSSEKFLDIIEKRSKILDINDSRIAVQEDENLGSTCGPDDLAYVIYTSGSTGKPKGVMIENKQLNNFIQAISKEVQMDQFESILCITTISFDIFGLETLAPLVKGLKVVMTSKSEQMEGDKLAQVIEKNNIDVAQFTPSRLNSMISSDKLKAALKRLKVMLVGGEAVTSKVMKNLEPYKELKVYNVYGPTETTIWSTIKLLTQKQKITIGKPIGNTQIYILDKNMKLVPEGIYGELWIGGDGLARGYLNRPELTSERFVENPFISESKIYRTGDLARWNMDGDIEFAGRIDDQIKLRGYRIELGEIESVYSNHEDINEIVVLPKENKFLCAYIVFNNHIETRDLRDFGRNKLPEYMIPTYFIEVEKIPLKVSGKIHKKKLLDMELRDNKKEKILPRSLQENIIVEIWRELLGVENIYVDDDFFELGGNSINIIEVAREIENRLEVNIAPADLIVNSKVVDLAEHVLQKNTEECDLKNIFKLNNSSSEKKIFIVHGADGDIFYYRHLAKLMESEYSVYGIQPRGLGGKEPLPQSYYEMLSNYIKEIRQIQPKGPYIISGYCIGGYLAFDIVAILEMQGEKVGALLELDQEPFIEKRLYKSIGGVNKLLKGFDLVRKTTYRDKSFTMEKFMKTVGKRHIISEERQAEIISNRDNIFEFFCGELMVESRYMYLSRKVKTPTLVVKARENNHKLFEQESWDNMTSGTLKFIEIPGGHETVLLPPYVQKMSEVIKEFLLENLKDQ